MKYFVLCALLFSGAFFSSAYSQDHNPCPNGGVLYLGMCTTSIGTKTQTIFSVTSPTTYRGITGSGDNNMDAMIASQAAVAAALLGNTNTETQTSNVTGYNCTLTTSNWRWEVTNYGANGTSYTLVWYFDRLYTRVAGQSTSFPNGNCPQRLDERGTEKRIGNQVSIGGSFATSEVEQCPPEGMQQFNLGPYQTESGQSLCFYNSVEKEPDPECDCANFAGESLTTANTLRAPAGTYTNENPPQCVMQQEFVVGRDAPLTCTCQVSAQKWLKTNSGNENGVDFERWETLPTQQGQPSGTFTGVKCGDKDGGLLEPEDNAPKDCFTLKNGTKWCWADPAAHCQIVNGQEQCSSGCGRVNGDFACYEDQPPIIPPRDDTELDSIDDNITEPNKSLNDMQKSDFKDINRGIEQRLGNVVVALGNNQNSTDKVANQLGITNSNLDGIGMQLDGIGKQIGDINGTLDGAFGDAGQPDTGKGDCVENCSWYTSAYPDGLIGIWEEHSAAIQQTPAFSFLNQFTMSPDGAQPDMNFCFNLGALGNFGCDAIEVPSVIWAFLKMIILISAAFLCRALIFGG